MATTIAAYNVALSLKAQGYIDASRLSREETKALKQTISSIETDLDKYERGLLRLQIAKGKLAITDEHYQRALVALTLKYKELPPVIDVVTASLVKQETQQKSILPLLGKLTAGYFALKGSFDWLLRPMIKLSGEAESTAIQFGVLLGSGDKANTMLSEMRRLAAASPLTFEDVSKAGKTMLAFGLETESVLPSLKRLADISVGNSERFASLALAFGQVRASGRLMGQEVLQFVNAGFNPLQQIAEKTGISMAELKKRMEAGGISFKMVEQAIIDATSSGGRFFGMTEQLSETFQGKFAQSVDKTQAVLRTFGESLLPLVNELLDAFTSLSGALDDTSAGSLDLLDIWQAGIRTLRYLVAVQRDVREAFVNLFSDPTNLLTDPFKNQNAFTDAIGREDERLRGIRAKLKEDEANNEALMKSSQSEYFALEAKNPRAASQVSESIRQKGFAGELTAQDYINAIKDMKDIIAKQAEINRKQLEQQMAGNQKLDKLRPVERVR